MGSREILCGDIGRRLPRAAPLSPTPPALPQPHSPRAPASRSRPSTHERARCARPPGPERRGRRCPAQGTRSTSCLGYPAFAFFCCARLWTSSAYSCSWLVWRINIIVVKARDILRCFCETLVVVVVSRKCNVGHHHLTCFLHRRAHNEDAASLRCAGTPITRLRFLLGTNARASA